MFNGVEAERAATEIQEVVKSELKKYTGSVREEVRNAQIIASLNRINDKCEDVRLAGKSDYY